jgi:zinc protease
MTEPRVDQVALNQTIAAERPVVADPSTDPQSAEYDALVDLRYGGELRYTVLPSLEEFDTLDLAGVERVWNERYGDAGDWVFVFSGDFDTVTMIDLANSYLGTLPGTGTVEQPIDVEPAPPSSVVSSTITAGSGATASLSMLFDDPVPSITAALWAHTELVTNLLRARLTEVIREEYGDTYSPFAISYFAADPDPIVETYVNVSGSPDRIEQIGDLVVAEIADLIARGPTDDEFDAAFAETSEQYNFVDNGQFLSALINDALDPEQPVENYIERFFALDDVSRSSVQQYLADHVSPDAFVEVITVPRG